MSDHATRTVERHCDVAVIGGSPAALEAALHLARERRSVIVIDADEPRGTPGLPPADLNAVGREDLRSHGGEVLTGRVLRVTRTDGDRFRVELVGGHSIVARRVLTAGGPVDGLPDVAGTDAGGATAVPGLYAAGNLTETSHPAVPAAADGGRVGAVINASLASEDSEAPAGPSANQADWDHRYGGDRVWSGNPNGALVHEVRGLAPGRALDVGAGEGADALWLAEQGWSVTASDISERALDRVRAEAERRGLRVECHHGDANALEGLEAGAFDLVSAHYASIPRTPERRAVHNLLDAVAPGGTLLVVNHDLEPMRAPIDGPGHGPPFDPDAYVRVDDFAAALADSPAWDIEVHQKRPRPPGAASASHHVDDIVLRARRRAG